MRVLMAEDDGATLVRLAAEVRALGHEVVTAPDGRAAWDEYLRWRPGLVITDWLMPLIDGAELCRLIRSEDRTRYTYVILLTVLSGRGSYLEGMKAGADDFVTKPVAPDELAARLRVAERILSLQREIKQLEGLLPICAYCKKIRDDATRWVPVEQYIHLRTHAEFSHGICPDCLREQSALAHQE